MSDAPDHPDWFDADEAAEERPAADPAPAGADWFDDPERLDPTPANEPWESDGGTTAAASTGGASATNGDRAASAAGTPAREADGPTGAGDTGDGTREHTTERGRERRQDDSGGGILAWLKRLLGLN